MVSAHVCRQRGLLVLVLVLVLVLGASVQATCPGSPWREWRGHCYRLTYDEVPWHGVRGDCKAFFRSADAASVTSKAENDFILNTLAGRQSVWLGMRSANDLLSWVDGSRVGYRNFPSSRTKTSGAQDVVQMDASGRWRFAASHTAGPLRGVCKMASCSCPAGWTEWDRRCYRAVTQRLSWTEARNHCRRLAPTADLVSIINGRENNFVHGLLKQYPLWIGLNDREEEGRFVSSSGEKYSYTNWHLPSEPNGANHAADCVEMLRDKTWADSSCHAAGPAHPFVCETIICGRDQQILREPVRGRQIRLWRPDVPAEARCPADWTPSGDRCYQTVPTADTFARMQQKCSLKHPSAAIAVLGNIEDNDRAFFEADALPMWIDYGSRSGRALNLASERRGDRRTFTYWEPDVTLARSVDSDCAALDKSSQWRPHSCDRARLPGLCELPACLPECPGGWTQYEGRCYRLLKQRRTRADSSAVCQQQGGQLASLQSQDEADFVLTLAFKFGADYSRWFDRYAWIGPTRADAAAAWSWADCSPWTISRWRGGDGAAAGLTNGTCAALLYTGRWADNVNCARGLFSAVCELDPCRDHFGPTDRSGCRSGKDMAPLTEATEPPVKVVEPPTTGQADTWICPPGWTQLNGYCHMAVTKPGTFIDALQTCTITYNPSNVASVHSPRENALILELTGGEPSWLGLTAAYDFPLWRWLDGSDAETYTAWAPHQPNGDMNNLRVCGAVNKKGTWLALSCTERQLKFVCRLPAVRVVPRPTCPDPTVWREEGGACLTFNRDGATYAEARTACASRGGQNFTARLPVIGGAEKNQAMQRLANGHVVRLGLTNDWPDGRWRWEDGSPVAFASWLSPPVAGQRSLCASLDGRRGGWVTQSCSDSVPFYCEIAPEGESAVSSEYGDYDYNYDYDY